MKVIGAIITLPLLFVIPGYFLIRSRLFTSKEMPWIERLLLIIVTSASAASLIALFLAEAGYLRIWLLDLLLAAVAIAARLIFGDTKTRVLSPRPPRWELVVVVILVLLSLFMFFKPAEYVSGDADPGYYFNTGYHLAHTGSMSVYDKSVPKMSEAELRTFYAAGISQFMPFHLRNRATGRIQPLLYHLLPTWIGIFIMLFGTWGGLYVVPLFALLGMLALFALARRFSGLLGATIAGLLGILFFLQVWFSRAPVSEVFCQVFVLSAILFFCDFLASRDVLVGIATAASVTVAATARPEAVVLVIPMLVVMAARMFTDRYRAGDYAFVNALLLGLVYVWFYVRFAEYHYVRTNVAKVIRLLGPQAGMNTFLALWAALIGAALIFFNLRPLNRYLARLGERISSRLGNHRQDIARSAKAALALATVATFVYFYSAPAAARSSQKFFSNTALLFGGLTVFVFVAGLCLLVYEMDSLGTSFVIAAFVIVNTLSLQESSLALGQFPWDSRRFMLVVVPMLAVGLGYLAGRLWKTKRVELRTLAIAASVCFLALFSYHLAPIYNHTDYKGIDRQLTSLSKKMDKNVVIFTDVFEGEAFGIPLRYQHNVDARRAYDLSNARDFARIVRKYNKEGKKVLIETSGIAAKEIPVDPNLAGLLDFKKAFDVRLSFPRLSPVPSGRPQNTGIERHDIEFFTVEPKVG